MTSPPCKCCGGATSHFATVDFSRCCEDRRAPIFPPSGEPVHYVRCRRCEFLFTTHFDELEPSEMAEKIYNADYIWADPEFASGRPRYYADLLQQALGSVRTEITALDFGGGRGLLAERMRGAGFPGFVSYDPFFDMAPAPAGGFDLVTAFEVAEHSRDPLATFREMMALLRPGGALLFSTLLQPDPLDAEWWYMAPRNGHISLFSRRSLEIAANSMGSGVLSISAGLHLFFRSPPNTVAQAVANHFARGAMRSASLLGVMPLMETSRQLVRLGQTTKVFDLRHAMRAALRQVGVPIAR